MRDVINKSLIPAKFKLTTKEKVIMIIIIILLIVGIVEGWRKNIDIIEVNAKNEEYQKELKEAKIREQEEKERKRREKLPELTQEGIENVNHIYNSDTKRAFLTFDDGPSSNTQPILDVLKEKGVKATFFVLGSNVQKAPETVKRIYNEGHFIANHGYSHVYTDIYQSPQTVLDEYNRCNQLVREAIGEQEYNSHLFRFPGGFVGGQYAEIKNQAKDLLLQNNIVHVDWNALNGDSETKEPTMDFELQRIADTTCNKQSVVILMHDAETKKVTVEALPNIIEYLKGQGYEFKNFYELIK